MKIFLAFIFYFLSITINAQTCDSLIIINTPTYSDGYQNFPATFEIDSLINGLIISKTINGQRSEYRYDSLQRLTNIAGTDSTAFLYDSLSRLIYTDYYSFNGTNWIYKTDTARSAHLFNTNNQDSIEILYSWNGSALIPFHEYSYFYNSNDTLVRIEIRNRYSLQLIFDSLTIVSYPSGLVGISRVDTTSADSISHPFLPMNITYYDSLNHIIEIDEMFSSTILLYFKEFDYSCNQLSNYFGTCGDCHASYECLYVEFDSLCRIKTYTFGF